MKYPIQISILVIAILLSISITYGARTVDSYNDVKVEWEAENACIAELVSLGIERKDIVRDSGSCKRK